MAEKKEKWPSVDQQLRAAQAPKGSRLQALIRENQDFKLLAPEELNDAYPIPLWLRVFYRKQHPELSFPSRNPGAAYPEVLTQLHRRMLAHPNEPWGGTAPGQRPNPPKGRK